MRLAWVVFLAVAVLVTTLLYLPEQVTLVLGDWVVRTHTIVAITATIVVLVVLYVLFGMLHLMRSTPTMWRLWRKAKLQEKRARCLEKGVSLLIQGDWRKAKQVLDAGAKLSDKPGVYYLGAAQALHYLGEEGESAKLLDQASQSGTEMTISAALTRARLLESSGDRGRAIEVLQQLPKGKGHESKNYLLQLLCAERRWRQVLQLVGKSNLDKVQIEAMSKKAWAGLLRQAAASGVRDSANETWMQMPRRLRRDDDMLSAYVRASLRLGLTIKCEPLLKKRLKKKDQPLPHELVMLYGRLASNIKGQLAFIESLLQRHPTNAALLCVAGVLCLRDGQQQRGRSYLEASMQMEPRQEIHRAIALLCEQQGDIECALQNYRAAMSIESGPSKAIVDQQVVSLLQQEDREETVPPRHS